MRLAIGDGLVIRSLVSGDAPRLAELLDNREIWLQVRDKLPHPYTLADAEEWIARTRAQTPETNFAIATSREHSGGAPVEDRGELHDMVPGEVAGGIGLILQEDVFRRSAEIGYWVGEPYWGRGIATRAVRAFTAWAFESFDLERLYAGVFDTNPASARVLEKAGWELEGRLRRAAIKDGRVLDQLLYATLRPAQRPDGET